MEQNQFDEFIPVEEEQPESGATYSLQTERYVIGSAILDNNGLREVLNRISHEQFYDSRHIAIMQAIEELNEKDRPVDYPNILEQLKRMKKIDAAGGASYIEQIIDSVPSSYDITSYIDIVQENFLLRELHKACSEINSNIDTGKKDFSELSSFAVRKVSGVAEKQKTGDIKAAQKYTEDVIRMAEGEGLNAQGLLGVDTGFHTLNRYTKGFKKGEFIVLGARPGVGKSALAMNMAINAALTSDCKIAYFSLEMSNEQLVGRIISTLSGVPFGKIQDGKVTEEEMTRIYGAKAQVDELKIYLSADENSNLSDIQAKCLKLSRSGNLDLVIVDYLQLVNDSDSKKGSSNRQEEVARISRGLKKMALQLGVPVLALSQLNRDIDKQEGRTEPTIADIRESGSIEQDADIILLLYRKQEPKPEDGEENKGPTNHKIFLSVAKNRQGKQGKIGLYFKGNQFKFTEVEDDDESDLD